MLRESRSQELKDRVMAENPKLNKDFIFTGLGRNARTTDLASTLVLSNFSRIDENNKKRIANFQYFIENLNSEKYHIDFEMAGQCNYAFLVLLKNKSVEARDKMQKALRENSIEFRQGLSGGGSQLLQPYLKGIIEVDQRDYPVMNWVNDSSVYIGNYPSLERYKITNLLRILNSIDF